MTDRRDGSLFVSEGTKPDHCATGSGASEPVVLTPTQLAALRRFEAGETMPAHFSITTCNVLLKYALIAVDAVGDWLGDRDDFARGKITQKGARLLRVLGEPVKTVPMRVVYWPDNDKSHDARACLVLCTRRERNIRRIRELSTICGTSCTDAKRTSKKPAESYCMTCLAGSARGVLG